MAKSNYDGYVGATQKDRAKGASKMYSQDYEGMKTAYETYKKKGDPSSKDMKDSLRVGNEKAAGTLQRAGRDSDNERIRERRREESHQKWAAGGPRKGVEDKKR